MRDAMPAAAGTTVRGAADERHTQIQCCVSASPPSSRAYSSQSGLQPPLVRPVLNARRAYASRTTRLTTAQEKQHPSNPSTAARGGSCSVAVDVMGPRPGCRPGWSIDPFALLAGRLFVFVAKIPGWKSQDMLPASQSRRPSATPTHLALSGSSPGVEAEGEI